MCSWSICRNEHLPEMTEKNHHSETYGVLIQDKTFKVNKQYVCRSSKHHHVMVCKSLINLM